MRLSSGIERTLVAVCGIIAAPLAAAAALTTVVVVVVCALLLNDGISSLAAGDGGWAPTSFVIFIGLLALVCWVGVKSVLSVAHWIDGPR